MVNWYYNFITHRNLHVEINGTTASKTVCIGFPQGGYAVPNSGLLHLMKQ